jgi:two-component system, cell cycle response regulator DivK
VIAALAMDRSLPPTSPPTVLVVDDFEDVCTLLVRLFRRSGFEAACSTNARGAMELMRTHRPAVVVLDDSMPDMSGLDLVDFMRHDDSLKSIPVVMYSAASEAERVNRAKELGVVAWISKDGTFGPLKQAVSKALT